MCLFYCGVFLPEAELMIGYYSIIFNQWEGPFEKGFSKTLDTMGKRLIGR
jgi:hypothetical protein